METVFRRKEVEELVAGWAVLPQPVLIGGRTARNLVGFAGGWFSCPADMFLVVGLKKPASASVVRYQP